MPKEKNNIQNIQLLVAIADFIHSNNFSPTVRELCDLTGTASTSTIQLRLNALEEEGLITMIHGKSRTIRINENMCHIAY